MTIERPENPLLQFGKQLGRDEIYAAVLSAALTALAYFVIDIMSGGSPPLWVTATVLPLVGPVMEKPGLVAHYIGEAIRDWRREGGSIGPHIRRCLFDGRAWRTVRADILYHDPAYTALMAVGIAAFAPQSALQVALLATMAFFGAVTVAAILEVGFVEWRYRRFLRGLAKRGFETEEYFESRYLMVDGGAGCTCPSDILDDIASRFQLLDRYAFEYEDSYFVSHALKGFNHRKATLRFRDRSWAGGDGTERHRKSLQAVYTHSHEVSSREASLYRCFPVHKEKHYKKLSDDISFEDIVGEYGGETGQESKTLAFRRMVARNPDGLYVSVDAVRGESPAVLIEVKVRNDLELLKRANDYIAMRYPVAGTTMGKVHLGELRKEHEFAPAECGSCASE